MTLASAFFPAYLYTLENLAERDYFAQQAPSQCSDGHTYYWDEQAVRKALVRHVGPIAWPLDPDNVAGIPDDEVLRYVTGFFQLVSRPTDSWFHEFCRSSHPTAFDTASGRYDYTVDVNALFGRFQTGLVLQNGRIKGTTGSFTLNRRLGDALPFGGDQHLEKLISSGLHEFQTSDPRRRWQGLRHLADAYERVKTLQVPENKKASTAALIGAMSPEAALGEHLDGLLRQMTTLSNGLTIRHHEVGKVDITEDPVLVDFLFYSYYNVLRFALQRLFSED
ncbi:hypothetical protein [Blastococcus sp. PRF04-17]|uniref:hypothetical protein n=1 Tax=Blastococcus sp. PRF04-17 TaxID=2933797 RepID=UPI001FF3A7E5|nr:hypothetical protein [Blastococcus sp. PRF04-17]UOY01649.1 hypothetical protein MVA48_22470 [Blastococcus sp. PRF04-17]